MTAPTPSPEYGEQEVMTRTAANGPAVGRELGPFSLQENPHREAETSVAADALTDRLTKVAYATEFLDVREDILALIERDRRRWLDNIAVCELLAKARADLAVHGAPDRPRR